MYIGRHRLLHTMVVPLRLSWGTMVVSDAAESMHIIRSGTEGTQSVS